MISGRKCVWVGLAVVAMAAAGGLSLRRYGNTRTIQADGYVGSSSCRSCHEKFYQLWSTSHHGRAMQRYSADVAHAAGLVDSPPIRIGAATYRAELSGQNGWIVEQSAAGQRRYAIELALGGKNVYYFLTSLDRGYLQVLPLAFDVRGKAWINATESMTMHENVSRGEALDWHDRALTFNTSCYDCHVSQLETNYDATTDSYHTGWLEPGINCEMCHGPAGKHVRLYRWAEKMGRNPDELGLISFKALTHAQRNDACGACHAKASAITAGFRAGEKFFDHFALAAFENPDFYPDGRDLGENYTFTAWMLSPCAKSGQLDCVHCHTSSGRYRFAKGDPNAACLPCHQELVESSSAHSHHRPDSLGNHCVSCHMPMTEYARMRRSDHSMRAPAPAATLAYHSPNACNACHRDKDARWANTKVHQWYRRDYQASILAKAELIEAARKRAWTNLPKMLVYIDDPHHDTVFAASLIRLLGACPDSRKFDTMRSALKDSSPMVRAAAIDILAQHPDASTANLIAQYSKDESRLVRIRAAAALGAVPLQTLDEASRANVQTATQEYFASLTTRQDNYAQRLNLGNYYAERGQLNEAVTEYETAASLRAGFAPPLVNASVVYSQLGNMEKAEGALRRAISAEPQNASAHFNLGLLLAETGRSDDAARELRRSLQLDNSNAAAAYNLAVLVGTKDPSQALVLSRKAVQLSPENPKYRSAVAYYEKRLR